MGGGTKGSDAFWFSGADWKVNQDLTFQYYYANLEDYYKQNFLGLVHIAQIVPGHILKTDLRYFNSRSDGNTGQDGYKFNNDSGYAKHPDKVNNDTWSAMFTYTIWGYSLLLGHQQVGDDGEMTAINNGSVRDGRGAPKEKVAQPIISSLTQ